MNEEIEKYWQELDRALFLTRDYVKYAEVDSPLPIGFGQTISQPSLVLEMTKLLNPCKDSRVLEIGTGSGYQTALLAKFSKHVYTIELIRELSDAARARLEKIGAANVSFRTGDGSSGWPEEAPFDRIMVTAGAGSIPECLTVQLAGNGVMIVPVGERMSQKLMYIKKDKKGRLSYENKGGVVFVEFKGLYGFNP